MRSGFFKWGVKVGFVENTVFQHIKGPFVNYVAKNHDYLTVRPSLTTIWFMNDPKYKNQVEYDIFGCAQIIKLSTTLNKIKFYTV